MKVFPETHNTFINIIMIYSNYQQRRSPGLLALWTERNLKLGRIVFVKKVFLPPFYININHKS